MQDRRSMGRGMLATVAAILLNVASGPAGSAAMPQEDRWDPRHISLLPAEIRNRLAAQQRVCGAPLAAEHAFSRSLSGVGPRSEFVALHYEHLRCGDRTANCDERGCLHEVYAAAGGRFRPVLRIHVRELELRLVGGRPAVGLDCEPYGTGCRAILYWKGRAFAK